MCQPMEVWPYEIEVSWTYVIHACMCAGIFAKAKGKTTWSRAVPCRESIQKLNIKKKTIITKIKCK